MFLPWKNNRKVTFKIEWTRLNYIEFQKISSWQSIIYQFRIYRNNLKYNVTNKLIMSNPNYINYLLCIKWRDSSIHSYGIFANHFILLGKCSQKIQRIFLIFSHSSLWILSSSASLLHQNYYKQKILRL